MGAARLRYLWFHTVVSGCLLYQKFRHAEQLSVVENLLVLCQGKHVLGLLSLTCTYFTVCDTRQFTGVVGVTEFFNNRFW